MTETAWQAIGRIAKERRERLRLNQDELGQYGGPKVATVGKFERAVATFPLRTQHQIEKALGWTRGTIEDVVATLEEGALDISDWEHDLIYEDIPDLSQPLGEAQADGALEALGYILSLLEPARRDDAVKAAVGAMLPFVSMDGATQLGTDLRKAHEPQPPAFRNKDDERAWRADQLERQQAAVRGQQEALRDEEASGEVDGRDVSHERDG